MSVVHSSDQNNPTSAVSQEERRSPEQVLQEIEKLSHRLREFTSNGAAQGESFDNVEREVWEIVLRTGFCAMELFVKLQGTGDLSEQVVTDDQQTLQRGSEPTRSVVRSIFGEHVFEQYTYSPGKNKKVLLYSVSARMELPENRWSYLLQEFSQIFCVDQAFKQSADNLETVLGQPFSVDTLEQTSQRMGVQAGEFLDQLPVPAKKDEGQLLVASADCKGVPLLKEDAAQVAAFETAKKRPGNRRMATVTSVYTVDPHVRTAEQITEALFRDKSAAKSKTRGRSKRPKPQHKHTTAHFPTIFQDDDQTVRISGIHEGMAWLAGQVDARRQMQQMLILLMDGQASLWDVADLHLHDDQRLVEILDIIHVASYVWDASLLFHQSMEVRKAFTRERLLKILKGELSGVIRGLRRMGSLRKFKGKKLKDLLRICGYFEKHQDRMRYDEYLAAGYPIASGVIEGACGHLVKDRMERSGMRWTLENARSMLNVRAVFQSDYWNEFCEQRITQLADTVHPHRNLVGDYTPLTIAC
jgi:hypothetical protein